MKNIWNLIQAGIAAIGGWMGWFLGGIDGLLNALILFVAIDYITGVMAAIVDKQLSSRIGARGILKKIAVFVLVGIAHVIDSELIGSGSVVRTATICFYLSNEGISILENVTLIGLPIPQKLKDVLLQIGKTEDKR
ncbi:MAG: phage holin family protein [Oscillospiraceae bacterium]|nr:phage holin family protein [Oscillospiraceae bacterium]